MPGEVRGARFYSGAIRFRNVFERIYGFPDLADSGGRLRGAGEARPRRPPGARAIFTASFVVPHATSPVSRLVGASSASCAESIEASRTLLRAHHTAVLLARAVVSGAPTALTREEPA